MSMFSFKFILSILIIAIGVVGVICFVFINISRGKRSSNSASVYNAPVHAASQASDTKVCPNCNTPIGEGISFCMMCGTKVK